MIHSGRSRLIGMVTEISLNLPPFAKEQGYRAIAELDLMGEIDSDESGVAHFRRGVSDYPVIGDPASLLTSDEFRLVYKKSDAPSGTVGRLQQDPSIEAYINVNELLSKHFAVLGTTGVGKSSGVAVILQQCCEPRPDLRIFLLDAHNEYGKVLRRQALVLNPRNLKLPFWLFNFEEIVDVFFAGRAGDRGRNRDSRRGHSAARRPVPALPRAPPSAPPSRRPTPTAAGYHGRHAGSLRARRHGRR